MTVENNSGGSSATVVNGVAVEKGSGGSTVTADSRGSGMKLKTEWN